MRESVGAGDAIDEFSGISAELSAVKRRNTSKGKEGVRVSVIEEIFYGNLCPAERFV